MTKLKNILNQSLRYSLATLFLLSGIGLAFVSGGMTFLMYTSNYNQEDLRYIITGAMAIILQGNVLLMSLGVAYVRIYAPQHLNKMRILLIISFVLSIVGSISFFTNENENQLKEGTYNLVIEDMLHIFTFGLLDKFKKTVQTIIGIWAICIFVEYLVIFLPNLAISIFTGKYQKYISYGLSVKDLILILLFSPQRKKDLQKFINIFLNPSIEKVNSKLKEAENTKFIDNNKKVINLKDKVITQNEKGNNQNEKVTTKNKKVVTTKSKGNNQNEKSINKEEVVVAIETGITKREQAKRNLELVKTYIFDKYKDGEEVKKSEVTNKFQLSTKQWYSILKKLKENGIVEINGTSTIKRGNNSFEKGTNKEPQKKDTK